MTNNKNHRGFIGLLGLLIAVGIMAFIAVKMLSKMYALPASSAGEPAEEALGNPSNQAPARSVIDSAKDAARAIEARSRDE